MLANYREALKNPAIAHPQYLRLDLERRTLQPDGTWSGWQKIDVDKNLDILDNLPAVEEELAPETVRPRELVDPLPFLNAGLWEKVHIASLVPKEKIKLPEEPKAQAGGMGRQRDAAAWAAAHGMMQMQNRCSSMHEQACSGRCRQQRRSDDGDDEPSSMGAGGGRPRRSSESAGNFWKSEEKQVMIRALDFTAEPNHSLSLSRPDRGLQPQLQPRRRHRRTASTTQEEDAGGPLEQGDRRRDHAAGRAALRRPDAAAGAPSDSQAVRSR